MSEYSEPDPESQGLSVEQFEQAQELNETLNTLSFTDTEFESTLDKVAFAIFGSLFINQEINLKSFDKKLNQARISIHHDIYFSRVLLYSTLGFLTGALTSVVIVAFGLSEIQSFPYEEYLPQEVAVIIAQYPVLIIGGGLFLVLAVGSFFAIIGGFILYPIYIANERKRKITSGLPYIVTFMYAMSRGGINIFEVIETAADTQDAYGEVATEFQAIVNNVQYSRTDLRTAIIEESEITPSPRLSQFLEDLLNVIDTGSDMEDFFLDKAEKYAEEQKKEQSQLLDTLEILSEMYVVLFVASPIFVLIIVVVMSFLGAGNVLYLYVLAYFALPIGGGLFTAIIWIISMDEESNNTRLDTHQVTNTREDRYSMSNVKANPQYTSYRRINLVKQLRSLLLAPFNKVVEIPSLTFLLTIPTAIAVILYFDVNLSVELTTTAFIETPEQNTLYFVFIPFVILVSPFTIIYELKQRERSIIRTRIPDAFTTAADSNARGLSLKESFEVVAKNSNDQLAKQLSLAIEESRWTKSLNSSLINFANQFEIPRLSRTIKLITRANDFTGDIQSVLRVAADNAKLKGELDSQRKQNAYMYIVVIFMSYLISVGIIIALDVSFIQSLGDFGIADGSGGGGNGLGAAGFGSIDTQMIQEFRMLFLHTIMTLGLSSGVVAATMANNDPLRGIKYSIVMSGLGLAGYMII